MFGDAGVTRARARGDGTHMKNLGKTTAATVAGLVTLFSRIKRGAFAAGTKLSAAATGAAGGTAKKLVIGGATLATAVTVGTTAMVVTDGFKAASLVSGGTMSGTMTVNEDATGTLTPLVSVDSTVTNAVDMRIGPPVMRIATGGQHVIGLAADGSAYGWGWGGSGQFGNTVNSLVIDPISIAQGSTWTTISAAPANTALIRSDGALFMAGDNNSGQIGDGTTTQRNAFVPVSAGTTWTAVSIGTYHTLALRGDGSLWSWGNNNYGQLGYGTTGGTNYAPARVGTANDWVDVDAGQWFSLALKADGTLWAWGYNGAGQLGLNDTAQRTSPTQVAVGSTFKSIEAACNQTRSYAIKSDDTLWGWGSGGVGDGTNNQRNAPVQIAPGTTFREVASEYQHALAVATDGSLWSWGQAQVGELGVGTRGVPALAPVRIGTDTGWSDVVAGVWTSFARRGGSLYSWGDTQGMARNDNYPGVSTPTTLTTAWIPYAAHSPWTLGSGDGTQTVWASYRDAGGTTILTTDTILADFSVPTGTMTINADATLSNSTTLTVCSAITNVVDMRVEGGSWQAYSPVAQTKLSPGDGVRTVTTDYRDEWGRITSMSDTITVDTTPPTGSLTLNGGAASTRFTSVSVTATADAVSMRAMGSVPFSKVVTNGGATMALKTDGTLWGAGNNTWGLLGDSGVQNSPYFKLSFAPAAVETTRTWKDVAMTSSYVLAVATDGTLWGWGDASYGFSDGYTSHPFPTRLDPTGTNWSKVWAGGQSAAAMDNTGALYMWGYNNDGQLGDGTQTNRTVRTRVGTASDYYKDVSLGYWNTMGIKTDGTLWGWGYNGDGALGIGNSVTPQKSPVKVGTATNWAQIATAGNCAAAIRTDGTLWTWGVNYQGNLGDSTPNSGRATPAQVGTGTNWKQVSISNGSVSAVKTDGTLWCWGYNASGQIGDGSKTDRRTPWRVGESADWKSAWSGANATFGIKADGTLWAWGYNQIIGQFGDGTTGGYSVYPIRTDFETFGSISKADLPAGDGVKTVSYLIRDAAGNVSTISDDITLDSGIPLGNVTVNGGAAYTNDPNLTLTSSVSWAADVRFAAPVRSIASGGTFTQFIGDDGVMWGTGGNNNGAMGTGASGFDTYPKPAFGSRGWTDVSAGTEYSLALKGSELWASGYNAYGQLGDGSSTTRLSPVLIPGSWKQVSAGYLQSAGVKNDGTLWTWGYNGSGQLGLNNYSSTLVPTSVGGNGWKQVANGQGYFMMGLSDTGTLFAWGDNTYGQLGLGNKTGRNYPTQVGTAGEWSAVAVGQYHTLGIKKDGSLWAWGRNNMGQAGRSDITTEVLSPYKIGIGFGAVAAGTQHSMARKSDGTLWVFGDNAVGQLGLGDTNVRRQPVRVGTSNDWVLIDAEANNSSATKTDGTAWACGAGGSGQLGQSNSSNKSSFVMMPPAWGAYTATKALTAPYPLGNSRIYGQYRDVAGNVVSLYDDIILDTTPPVTTPLGVPAGWSTTSPVTMSMSVVDSYTATTETLVSVNGAAATVYSAPIVFSTPGTTTVTYASKDAAGNVETTKTVMVRIDTVTPRTTTNAGNAWTNDPAVTLAPDDATSGIADTYYRLDGGAVTTYTAGLSLADGEHTFSYWSVDRAGNVESSHTVTPKIDRVKPASSSSALPTDWVSSNVVVALSASDDRSGVAGVRYRVDGGVTSTFTADIVVTNGVHTLQWWAVDTAGNAEDPHTETIKVDTAVPQSATSVDGQWHASSQIITLNAQDDESGVAKTYYRIGDDDLTMVYGGGFVWTTEGTSTLEYWSEDAMGNVEPKHSIPVLIDYTPPSSVASGVPTGISDRDVKVSLSATDGASGVATIWYRVNSGEKRPYVSGQSALVIGKDGTTTVEYWAEDAVGNDEVSKTFTVRIARPQGGTSAGAKNATCLECHTSPAMPGRAMNFDVAAVDRTTACPKCHFSGLAQTHPYHNSGGNCAVCHGTGWGPSMNSAAPKVVTTAGAFMAADSKDVDAFTLHVIHSTPRWPAGISKPSSVCGSCHATAACETCHSGNIDSGHGVHSAMGNEQYPRRQPLTLALSSGVPAGNQTVNTLSTEARQCATAECHNTPGVAAAGPTLREDATTAASGSTPANVVVKVGTWTAQYGGAYTAGRRSISNTTGSSLAIDFYGTRVAFIGDMASNLGVAKIWIDGSPVATVDQYSSITRNQVVLWTSPVMSRGNHTIKISPNGTKNPAATTLFVSVDQFQTWDDPPTSVAPYCTTTCHPDRVVSHGYADIDHVADVGDSIEPLSGAKCSACHSMDLMTEHERQGSVSKGGSCATCHGDPRGTFGTWNQSCQQAGCHTPGTSQAAHGRLPSAHGVTAGTRDHCTRNCHTAALPSEHGRTGASRGVVTCVQCHNSTEYVAAARNVSWTGKCEACHSIGHSKSGAANQPCFDCHGTTADEITAVAGAFAYGSTAGDHKTGYDTSAHGSKVPVGNNAGIETGIQCEACHDHGTMTPTSPTSLRVSGESLDRETFCYECHSRSGTETRTPVPNTWNGRDIAEEFARTSSHPTELSVAMSRLEATRTVFAQYQQAEFAVDDLFQASALAPTGSQLLWGSYVETPPTSKRVYAQAGWSNRLYQYDIARNAWGTDRYSPPNAPYESGYSGGNTAVTIGNKIYFGANWTRAEYTPANGVTNGSWTSVSSLPDQPSPSADLGLDEAHGKVYYGGHGYNYFVWDYIADTMSTVATKDESTGDVTIWNESAIAYVPEVDRLFVLSNNGWQSTNDGKLFFLQAPSTVSGTAHFTNTGINLARVAEQPYQYNRLKRITRSGHDYLMYFGLNTAGELETQLLSSLGGSTPTTQAVAPFPPFGVSSPSYNASIEWDGGEYIYACSRSGQFLRLHIPADPVNGTWPAWETLANAPLGGTGGCIQVATATPAPYTVDGYYRAGTVSAQVDLSKSARAWDRIEWLATTPSGTSVSVSVDGWDGSKWDALPQLSGLTGGSADISGIDASTYRKLRIKAWLSSTIDAVTPTLNQWVVTERVSVGDERNTVSLTCASCHNAHLVGTGGTDAWDVARVSDPLDTKRTVASTTDFCLRCHSIYATGSAKGASTLVPYPISFSAPGGLFPGWDKGSSQFGFTSSAHYTNGTTKALCENCHDPHGSNAARLGAWTRPASFADGQAGVRDNTTGSGSEENLCLQCHGNVDRAGRQAPGAPDIATTIYAPYGHNQDPVGAHSDTETIATIKARRHAECVDCHDPHAGQAGTHRQGLSVAGKAVRGAVGVKPTWSTTPMSTPTTLTPVRMGSRGDEPEAYLCLKCHSGTEGLPATETRTNGTTYVPTDIAAEFNPNNASFHNVLGVGGMKTVFNVGGVDYSWSRPADSEYLKPGWTAESQVTCTDCHTSGALTAAKGPHGSSVEFMIDPAYPADYTYASLDFRNPDGVWPTGQLICTKCHVFNRTQNVAHGTSTLIQGPTPVHTREYMDSIRCTSCHVGIPHGWKRPRMIAYGSDPAPYRAQSGAYRGQLDAISLENHTPNGWNMGDCNGCGIWAHQYGLSRWP